MSAESSVQESSSSKPRHRMSTRQRLLFFLVAWLIVLMPFLFWWNTWFGRRLSDQQLAAYLHDDKKPRHMQHALVQIGERMSHGDRSLSRWYPDVVRLASYPIEEVRSTDAWLMGQDNTANEFHRELLKMLNDPSLTVRGNAALSLVRFGDASGRPQIVSLLKPATIICPQAGKLADMAKVGGAVHANGLIAKVDANGSLIEVRSPIAGRVRSATVQTGQTLAQGSSLAVIEPDTEQVWEALRGLYLVGTIEDLPAILPYERELPDTPARVREQALLTDKAIHDRGK